MPRKKLVRSSEYPYHIVARCNNRDWYGLPLERVWTHYRRVMEKTSDKYNFRPLAFVLMGNHFHLLLETPLANIDAGMCYFMTQTSLALGAESGRINRIYGSRYKSSLITNEKYFLAAIKYVFRNPVRAHTCDKVENYKWSSLNREDFECGKSRVFPWPMKSNDLLNWLNQNTNPDDETAVSGALKRSVFAIKRINNHKHWDLQNYIEDSKTT